MRQALSLLSAFALVSQAADSPQTLRGYSPQSSVSEVQWEQRFKSIPNEDRLRENMRRLSARPHHVGSPYDKDNAEWIAAQLKSWGLDAQIEQFDTLFPTPKERSLELLEPVKYTAKLEEPALAVDPTSNQKSEQLPTYNAYSIDGDVTAPIVYVNYGSPDDYKELERMGVSVSGAIAVARYGLTWRGIKPKVAAEHGADPHEDGYFDGEVFPKGPMRPPAGVQRGSVMDMPVYPGDPATPGIGATPGAKKLPLNEITTLTKIPVMPISYEDAEPLLKNLSGELVPAAWRGSLPMPYHVGPGPAKAHLHLKFNWDRKPLYDVIVKIPGAKYPDQWIIRGNHHDGWVNGAEDPISGASPEMEEARGLAELLKQGWKPDRTIIYCFWDGEEPGLLGSTEWAETHADELRQHAAVYLNTDGNGRGFFGAEGSHSLEAFTNSVIKDIEDPETKMTVWKRLQLAGMAKSTPKVKAELKSRPDMRIGALGSGSDYTVFTDHLGVASLNIGYGGEDRGGIYHSIYDDFYWYTHFADTDFAYGRALAQTAGIMMMRLADADVLPFKFTNFAETIHTYIAEIKELDSDQRAHAKELDAEIDDGVYQAIADPKKKMVPPVKEPIPPYLNFAPLDNAADDLSRASEAYEKAFAAAGGPPTSADLNTKLIKTERLLTDAGGLPNRPWFENLVYAPGFYTGYGVKTLPGVREAIEQKRWSEADQQIVRVAKALQNEADLLDEATKEIGGH
jgi:N-acetylated-alpha-linked acidic dipeptidase